MNINELEIKNENKFEFNYLKLWLLFLLSLSFYLCFIFTNSFLHSFTSKIDISNITQWAKNSVVLDKGIELYVMFICMPFFLFLAYLISVSKIISSKFLHNQFFFITYSFIIFTIWGVFIVKNETIDLIGYCIFISGVLVAYLLQFLKNIKIPIYIYSIVLVFVVFLLGFIINDQASVFDYSFFIGPANKIIQGEKIGTFYMQYNVLSTLIIALLLKLNLTVNSMQILFQLIFAIWFLMYKKVANKLFKNRTIVTYFIFTLIIIRGFALVYYGGPINSPQTGPWRLDLWVPIVLIVLNYGFESIITSILFSLFYLMDDTFGFLYLLLYSVLLFVIMYNRYRISKIIVISKFKFYIPLVLSIIIHFLFFKSIMSPAGNLYSIYNFGLIPISRYSSFWLVVLILPICMYVLVNDKEKRVVLLFLFLLINIQLLYFFGRSHDNNLRHISGILLFVVFLSIDRLYSIVKQKHLFIIILSLFIGFVFFNYNRAIYSTYFKFKYLYLHGVSVNSPVDSIIKVESIFLKTLNTNKLILISQCDPYMNYRLGFKQIGYFSPIMANMFCDKNVSFLYNSIKSNYRIIIFKDNPLISLNVFNFGASIKSFNEILERNGLNEKFELDSLHNDMSELLLKRNNRIQ